MEIWKLSKKIGIIAEDQSDVDVVIEILAKYIARNKFTTSKFVGHGCGKLKSKCTRWVENLYASGCNLVIIVHDLDRNILDDLRREISGKVPSKYSATSLVVIPVEELEAWLLSDANAIKAVFNIRKKPSIQKDVEAISSPKEYLEDIVRGLGKVYANTLHNKKIATETNLSNLEALSSFSPFKDFMKSYSSHF